MPRPRPSRRRRPDDCRPARCPGFPSRASSTSGRSIRGRGTMAPCRQIRRGRRCPRSGGIRRASPDAAPWRSPHRTSRPGQGGASRHPACRGIRSRARRSSRRTSGRRAPRRCPDRFSAPVRRRPSPPALSHFSAAALACASTGSTARRRRAATSLSIVGAFRHQSWPRPRRDRAARRTPPVLRPPGDLVAAGLVRQLDILFRNIHNALLCAAAARIEIERELEALERVLARRRDQALSGKVDATEPDRLVQRIDDGRRLGRIGRLEFRLRLGGIEQVRCAVGRRW